MVDKGKPLVYKDHNIMPKCERHENAMVPHVTPDLVTRPHRETITEQDAQFLALFTFHRIEKELNRCQYINDQITTDLMKERTRCIKAVLARNEILHHQEQILPRTLEDINQIKDKTLCHAFMDNFYMPNVGDTRRLVSLLQSRQAALSRSQWLQHKLLEAQARVLEAGHVWLRHLAVRHMLQRLLRTGPLSEHQPPPRELCNDSPALLPTPVLSTLLDFFKQQVCLTEDYELDFQTSEQLIKPMELLELRGQIKNKNSIYMEEKLSEQNKVLQDLKEKTENVYAALSTEHHYIQQQLTSMKQEKLRMEKQSRTLLSGTRDWWSRQAMRLCSLLSVDSLLKAVLRRPGCQAAGTHHMCATLERHLQALLQQVFQLAPPGESQIHIEAQWIEKEKRALKAAKQAHKSVLRMRKLEERLKIALAPPYQKVKRASIPFEVEKKRKTVTVQLKYSPLGMEVPYCFEGDVDMKVVTKLYRPSPSLAEAAKREKPLLASWAAVAGVLLPSTAGGLEEMIRPRKSTESIVELLESRSSYDLVISTSPDSVGSAVRRDTVYCESDDDTSSSSELEHE